MSRLNFGIQEVKKVQIWGILKFGTWLDKWHSILKGTNIWCSMYALY